MANISSFMKKATAAVIVGHISIITGLQIYRQKKQNYHDPVNRKLLSWTQTLNGIPMLKEIASQTKKIASFTCRPDDIFIISYPKSGTSWLQEIVYNIQHEFQFAASNAQKLDERMPFLEWPSVVDSIQKLPSPRIIKTHLPLKLLPKSVIDSKCKMIYILRNPKDVAVSYYHFTKIIEPVGYTGTFHQYFDLFYQGQVPYGSWTDHVQEYWQLDTQDKLFITYEQLSEDPVGCIQRIARFLGKPELDNDKARILAHHCSFDKMRKNPSTDYQWLEESGLKKKGSSFYRKGKVGDWTSYFSPQMSTALETKVRNEINDSNLLNLVQYNIK